jgi:hypothetical protein
VYDAEGHVVINPKKKATYECLKNKEKLHLNFNSSLYKKQPEFICYKELVKPEIGDKIFMTELTQIESSNWFINLGSKVLLEIPETNAILKSPPPIYEKQNDTISAYMTPKYGKLDLPPTKITLVHTNSYFYPVFARLLLEGSIFKKLKSL